MTKACIGVVGLVALFLSSWPSQAQAWDQLDIQAKLRRPGVRLVVVEFCHEGDLDAQFLGRNPDMKPRRYT